MDSVAARQIVRNSLSTTDARTYGQLYCDVPATFRSFIHVIFKLPGRSINSGVFREQFFAIWYMN